jgi:aerobic carbon-monoxide dehydrogenase small subunit
MNDECVIEVVVNGDKKRLLVPTNQSLLDALRDTLRLTGSKHGCDMGDCGACTVEINGRPSLSCIRLAATCDGAQVTTIEGIGVQRASTVQVAFDEQVASQCGYCTPGFVVALEHLFAQDPDPSDQAITRCLGSNICRCTGYTKIISAAQIARERLNGRTE